MQNEIAAGLRNALERGSSLEKAMQTFVNAGYNPQEVKMAGQEFSGVSGIIYPDKAVLAESKAPENKNGLPPTPAITKAEIKQKIQDGKNKDNSKRILLIIAIVLVSLVFIGALSFLIYAINV